MDTLYLVFKHQFQIVLDLPYRRNELFRPKQTRTLTEEANSVKRGWKLIQVSFPGANYRYSPAAKLTKKVRSPTRKILFSTPSSLPELRSNLYVHLRVGELKMQFRILGLPE